MAVANVNLGIKKADEFIVIPLLVLDSAGVDRKPDSIQVLTWLDGGAALQFSVSNTTYPFSGIGVDTSKIFADTTYWYVKQISTIDGTPTPQNYNLAIDVITWTKVIATHNRATVQVISDSLEVMVDDITFIRDTVQGIIDTVQLQDNIHVLIRDTVYATIDTLQRFTKPATDTLQGIIDTLQLQDNIHVLIRDTVFASIDTLQLQDDIHVLIRDTVYATIDTLQRFTKPAVPSCASKLANHTESAILAASASETEAVMVSPKIANMTNESSTAGAALKAGVTVNESVAAVKSVILAICPAIAPSTNIT